jgi:hypothetical protein
MCRFGPGPVYRAYFKAKVVFQKREPTIEANICQWSKQVWPSIIFLTQLINNGARFHDAIITEH